MKEQIEEMRNEQIGEMAKSLDEALAHNVSWNSQNGVIAYSAEGIARELFDDGYRKQKEGEWVEHWSKVFECLYPVCSCCNNRSSQDRKWNYCPNCGAKMKGGAE